MSHETPHQHKKILLVDDHQVIRTSIRDWLELIFPQSDFIETGLGEEAVELAQRHSPDVIIMDISLPGIDGIEATKRIKKFLPDTFIIMVTINDSKQYETKSLEAGASAFVSKRKMSNELIYHLIDFFEKNVEANASETNTESEIGQMNTHIREVEGVLP